MFYEIDIYFDNNGVYRGLLLDSDELIKVEANGKLLSDWYTTFLLIKADAKEREITNFKVYISENFIQWFFDNAKNENFKYEMFRINKFENMVAVNGENLYKNLKSCFLGLKRWSYDDALKYITIKKFTLLSDVGFHKTDSKND
jgi:hypothetical protein